MRVLRKFEGLAGKFKDCSMLSPGFAICYEASIGIVQLQFNVSKPKVTEVAQKNQTACKKAFANTINGICVGRVYPHKPATLPCWQIPKGTPPIFPERYRSNGVVIPLFHSSFDIVPFLSGENMAQIDDRQRMTKVPAVYNLKGS